MEKVIFEHESNNYKLSLEVLNSFNDYREETFSAQLKLYTKDNLLIETENYLFPVKATKYTYLSLAYDFYLNHLQERYLLSTIAYDLYLKALRNGSELAKKL